MHNEFWQFLHIVETILIETQWVSPHLSNGGSSKRPAGFSMGGKSEDVFKEMRRMLHT